MCLRVSYQKKYEEKKICVLKVTEERSRIRSWIRIHQSEIRIHQSEIRIRTKMSRIPNTVFNDGFLQTIFSRIQNNGKNTT
jgi:hypothetical protein